ncbi:MAG: Lrp/AsnC family transcriptional regulator [Candidatus Bathyarchaeia archaeon]
MVSAVVLVNTDLSAQNEVVDGLKLIEGVEEALALYGVYDYYVKVKANSIDELKAVTKSQIRKVTGVTSLLTLMLNDL